MLAKSVAPSLAVLAGMIVCVRGESHTVLFDNRCGFGTPTLVSGGNILSTGAEFTTNGPINAVAYLQTGQSPETRPPRSHRTHQFFPPGSCGLNGENCTTVDISLANANPSYPGSGSSVAIDIDPPHAFSGPVEFRYYNGCDGVGESCANAVCQLPGPPQPIVCQTDNVNIEIIFCD